MLRIPQEIRPIIKEALSALFSFSTILAILLALDVFEIAYVVLVAIGAGITSALVVAFVPRLLRRFLRRIAWWVIVRAAKVYTIEVQAVGIGERDGGVVIRLGAGSDLSIAIGNRFNVYNAATRDIWGIVEVVQAYETSCVCKVVARRNEDFWITLEGRMGRDPSPPAGVTFSREVPEGILDVVRDILKS